MINFQTLIATKAARVCQAAQGEPVLEFGLRRAQGIDGGARPPAARRTSAACDATSNVLAGKLFGIPVKGTHAHSWVMSFDDELEAFEAYAGAMPNNCVFLVDTYDTLEGVRHAMRGRAKLREHGPRAGRHPPRLRRPRLPQHRGAARSSTRPGFPDAKILASNDLDEHIIASLKEQGATIGVWGVGTKLVTGVRPAGAGRRLQALGDPESRRGVGLQAQAVGADRQGVDPRRAAGAAFPQRRRVPGAMQSTTSAWARPPRRRPCTFIDPVDLDAAQDDRRRVPSTRTCSCRSSAPGDACTTRRRSRRYAGAAEQLAGFHAGVKRFVNPHQYPVGLEQRLSDLKTRLVLRARGSADAASPPPVPSPLAGEG